MLSLPLLIIGATDDSPDLNNTIHAQIEKVMDENTRNGIIVAVVGAVVGIGMFIACWGDYRMRVVR